VDEELFCSLLQGLNPHKTMGLDRVRPRVVREEVDVVARPLSIIPKMLQISGVVADE